MVKKVIGKSFLFRSSMFNSQTSHFWSILVPLRRLNFGLKDALDWSEMEVATTFFKDVVRTSSRKRPQDILQETSSRRLPGDVLKMSSTRRPQDLLKAPEDFKNFSGK